jgi:hypothetical protein
MKRLSLIVGIILLGAFSSANADFYIYGPGNSSCGKWLEEHKRGETPTWYGAADWVLGFVSAASAYRVSGELKHTDAAAIAAWVDNYCQQHPLDDLYHASGHLVEALKVKP